MYCIPLNIDYESIPMALFSIITRSVGEAGSSVHPQLGGSVGWQIEKLRKKAVGNAKANVVVVIVVPSVIVVFIAG